MANWKLGKIQYGFLETATSGGTLTLTASSKQYQVFTGSSTHTMKLPDATTMANGESFVVLNTSSGAITVQYNDTTTLATVNGNSAAELILTDFSTSNGVWRKFSSGGTGTAGANGIGAFGPGAAKTSNYSIVTGDRSGVINVDTTSGVVTITLPAPVSAFNITIKDSGGNAATNNITIARSSSTITIDSEVNDDVIDQNFGSISYISDGTNWFRISSEGLSYPFGPENGTGIGRGVFGGGTTGSNSLVMDYIAIATTSNATNFGNLTQARSGLAACASSLRGVFGGGDNGSQVNTIDYITIATTGNATTFGTLTTANESLASCSSSTRGIFGGGAAAPRTSAIQYITIATTGNGTSFGNLTSALSDLTALASPTRGVFGGGFDGSSTVVTIDYITIATTGNATNFGNLTVSRQDPGGCASATRGIFGGGDGFNNTIDYITIATTGNATNFGNLTVSRGELGACASSLRGVWGGGNTGSTSLVIDYVTIATTGNATNFGNLTVSRRNLAGCSDVHGGLT